MSLYHTNNYYAPAVAYTQWQQSFTISTEAIPVYQQPQVVPVAMPVVEEDKPKVIECEYCSVKQLPPTQAMERWSCCACGGPLPEE